MKHSIVIAHISALAQQFSFKINQALSFVSSINENETINSSSALQKHASESLNSAGKLYLTIAESVCESQSARKIKNFSSNLIKRRD
jgi:hypothetical protein